MLQTLLRRIVASALLLSMLHLPGPTLADDRRGRPPSVVPIVLIGSFNDAHRAKILRAVNEWNVALGNTLRFELLVDPSRPGIWSVIAIPESPYRNGPEALAVTMPFAKGGLVLVYLDRLGSRDLGMVMLHELGHVLGLRHGPRGVMAATYNPHDQKCVDHAALAEVAALHKLALRDMKGCGEPAR